MSEQGTTKDLSRPQGCGDNSCIHGRPGGMGTNGGCSCKKAPPKTVLARLRDLRDEAEAHGPVSLTADNILDLFTEIEGRDKEIARLQARVDVLNRCIDSIRELCEDNVCNVPYLRVVMDEIAMIGPMYERASRGAQVTDQLPSKKMVDGVIGCSDHSCVFGHPGGMGTNGGCHCLTDIRPPELRRRVSKNVQLLRAEIERLQQCHREGWNYAKEVEDEYERRTGRRFGTAQPPRDGQ
jgi:hypothetical protein